MIVRSLGTEGIVEDRAKCLGRSVSGVRSDAGIGAHGLDVCMAGERGDLFERALLFSNQIGEIKNPWWLADQELQVAVGLSKRAGSGRWGALRPRA